MKILQKGDLIWSGHRKEGPVPHYLVLDDEGSVFNILTRGYLEDDYMNFDDRRSMPPWVHKIMRGEHDVTEEVRAAIEEQKFKFGDRVVHQSDPTGAVGVVVRETEGTYTVVFNGFSGSGPLIENHASIHLRPA